MKRLTALTTVAVLTISAGTAAFAMNTNSTVDINDKAKEVPSIILEKIDSNNNSNNTLNKSNVIADNFNQMIELEKIRLQQGIDSGMISKAQADFWQSQINLMEKNYDNKNYNINDICPTSYGHDVMWDNNYNLNNSNNLATSKTQNRSNSIQQSSYKASAKQNTSMSNSNSVLKNNSVNSQNTRWNNMSNRNFNVCNNNYNNWNY